MTGGISSGGGAGIHPGAPIIWPSSKQESEVVEQSKETAQTGQVKTSQAPQAAPTSTPSEAEQTAKQIQQQQMATISRKMTLQDLTQQLMQANIRPTPANRQLAMQMLQHGLELSKDNFSKLSQLTQGDNKTISAAMLSMLKGLSGNKATVPLLAKFLQQNPQLSQQNQQTQNALQGFMSALQTGKGVLSPALASQLANLAGKWDSIFRKSPGKDQSSEMFLKEGTINDLRGFRSLLQGTLNNLQQTADSGSQQVQNTLKQLAQLEEEITEMLKNYTAQAILSKPNEKPDPAMPDKNAYWLIPNFLTDPPSDLEILIKKDSKSRKERIDPSKTKLVIKLQTDNLGELTTEINVSDRDLDFRFNTENENTKQAIHSNLKHLNKQMEAQNFKVKTVKVFKKKLDVKKLLVPIIDLDNLVRVRTQA